MVRLKCSEWMVYYLYDYVPLSKINCFDSNAVARRDAVAMRNRILNYKNKDDNEVALFTRDLMECIIELINTRIPDYVRNIGLVAVPSSKIAKKNVVKESIYQIKRWYDDGTIKSQYGCDKTFYDYSNLLTRVLDVGTAHLGDRPNFYEHLRSISCAEDNLSEKDITFIILDDITTTGITMNACKNILQNHGAVNRNIYKLALSRTVSYEDIIE